jgi:hypothetical protein
VGKTTAEQLTRKIIITNEELCFNKNLLTRNKIAIVYFNEQITAKLTINFFIEITIKNNKKIKE